MGPFHHLRSQFPLLNEFPQPKRRSLLRRGILTFYFGEVGLWHPSLLHFSTSDLSFGKGKAAVVMSYDSKITGKHYLKTKNQSVRSKISFLNNSGLTDILTVES